MTGGNGNGYNPGGSGGAPNVVPPDYVTGGGGYNPGSAAVSIIPSGGGGFNPGGGCSSGGCGSGFNPGSGGWTSG